MMERTLLCERPSSTCHSCFWYSEMARGGLLGRAASVHGRKRSNAVEVKTRIKMEPALFCSAQTYLFVQRIHRRIEAHHSTANAANLQSKERFPDFPAQTLASWSGPC